MTRSTLVAITSPGVDPMTLWRVMATIIKAPEQYRFEVTTEGIGAELSQGLDALLDLTHAADLSLIPESGCDEYCDPGCAGTWCREPAHYLLADFDSGYSFEAPCGCRSGGLHLRYVYELGAWLDRAGATWQWYDESGDGWNHGPDWGSLGSDGSACSTHRVLPAPPAGPRWKAAA